MSKTFHARKKNKKRNAFIFDPGGKKFKAWQERTPRSWYYEKLQP